MAENGVKYDNNLWNGSTNELLYDKPYENIEIRFSGFDEDEVEGFVRKLLQGLVEVNQENMFLNWVNKLSLAINARSWAGNSILQVHFAFVKLNNRPFANRTFPFYLKGW